MMARPLLYLFRQMMTTKMRLKEAEISIKAPWGNIAGLSWGEPNNPPVLLCHGKQDACSGFRPLVSRLPDCFFYISIDLPGNGRSDHLPRGVRYSILDLVPTILRVKEHYKWDKFIYIGHSLGVPIGKFFNIAYPGHISRTVELDPIPAHHTWPCTWEGMHDWYHRYYAPIYNDDKYAKINGALDTAPRYTYEKALEMTMTTRRLSKEAADQVLERCLVPAGDNLYRFTFDQRMKDVTVLPFSWEALKQIYTGTATPTFCILARAVIDNYIYKPVESFLMDEAAWPNKNYTFKIVDGDHDFHLENPDCMAEDIAKFLLDDLKAKL